MKYGGRLIPYIFLCLFFSIEISIREPEQNSLKIKNHLSDNKICYVDALFGYLTVASQKMRFANGTNLTLIVVSGQDSMYMVYNKIKKFSINEIKSRIYLLSLLKV